MIHINSCSLPHCDIIHSRNKLNLKGRRIIEMRERERERERERVRETEIDKQTDRHTEPETVHRQTNRRKKQQTRLKNGMIPYRFFVS